MMHKFTLLTLVSLFSVFAQASNLKVVATTGNSGKYLPQVSYLTNVSPQISHAGDITFFSQGFFGDVFSHGLFVKTAHEKEGKIRRVMNEGEFIGSLSLNNFGEILISTNDGGRSTDIFKYNFIEDKLSTILTPDADTFAMTSAMINDQSNYIYRVRKTNGLRSLIYKSENGERTLLEEGSNDISYIFSPVLRGDWLVVKVRYGQRGQYGESQPDKLWLFNLKKNTKRLVATDKDFMPSSKIDSIDNFYTVNALGHVAFWTHKKKKRYLYLSDQESLRVILKSSDLFKTVDMFKPSLNEIGQIVLRGTNRDGIQVISLYDFNSWKEIVREGDKSQDFENSYKIIKRRQLTFIGAPMINNNSQVVFNANTSITETGELVEAIYMLDTKKNEE